MPSHPLIPATLAALDHGPAGGTPLKLDMVDFHGDSKKPYKRSTDYLWVTLHDLQNRAVAVGSTFHSDSEEETTDFPAAVALAALKAAALPAIFHFGEERLGLADGHSGFDPTEKVSLSYWAGMAVAAFVGVEVLHASHVCHVSLLSSEEAKIKKAWTVNKKGKRVRSRREPDLICQELVPGKPDRHHVLEAKGGTSRPSPTKEAGWLNQARSITTINTRPPMTSSFCATHLHGEDGWKCKLHDPEPRPGGARSLRWDDARVAERYYRPHLRWLDTRQARAVEHAGRRLRVRLAAISLDGAFLFTGLDADLVKGFEQGRPTCQRPVEPLRSSAARVGADGIATLRLNTPCPF